MTSEITKLITAAVVTKGIIMATLLPLILTAEISEFGKAVILATISATITGAFTLLGAFIAAKYARRAAKGVHEDIKDVQRTLANGASDNGS